MTLSRPKPRASDRKRVDNQWKRRPQFKVDNWRRILLRQRLRLPEQVCAAPTFWYLYPNDVGETRNERTDIAKHRNFALIHSVGCKRADMNRKRWSQRWSTRRRSVGGGIAGKAGMARIQWRRPTSLHSTVRPSLSRSLGQGRLILTRLDRQIWLCSQSIPDFSDGF